MKRRDFLVSTFASALAISALDFKQAHAYNIPYNGLIDIQMNGKSQYLDDYTPFIDENNRTMVPLRFVSEKFGRTVDWHEESRYAIIRDDDSKALYFPVHSNFYIRNDGETIEMDTESVIHNNRLYIPLRYLAEELSLRVDFTFNNNKPLIVLEDKLYINSRNPDLKSYSVYPFNATILYTYNDLVADLNWLKRYYGDVLDIHSMGKSTSGEYDIWGIRLGNGEKVATAHGAMHGNEWLNIPILIEQIKEYASLYKSNGYYQGKNVRQLLDDVSIHFIPSVNPDGTALCQFGAYAFPQRAEELYRLNNNHVPAGYDFTRWKANINGVDLNRNMDTGMRELLRDDISNRRRPGFLEPTYAFFMGDDVESEVESKILCNHYRQKNSVLLLDYHSSGRILYWNFSNTNYNRQDDGSFVQVPDLLTTQARKIASAMSSVTGYINHDASAVHNNTTINRWGTYRLQIPSITVETTNVVDVQRTVGAMKFMNAYFNERSRVLYATLTAVAAI
ncbi:hypothetical protein BHF68_06450 [Desulfuribacillus alkaliarsenatis]|uniref:Peptidase M14 domain-containing protein n=1 Tax=Desulfuribacillus alkaliarsenatis TaxID=766136 RepID=A0A1E5G1C4_9FIRM|nr:hypothetical protein BHF68_06450 [Desulfuribacillus alkaliarsenatis]